jgi:small subunit ribosomal protein S8
MSHDVVSDALCKIMNAKKARKTEVFVSHYSKLLIGVLRIAKENGYIQSYGIEGDKKLKIVIGKLNRCNAIKPRFDIQSKDIDRYVRRYLPARNLGIIIISANTGLLIHQELIEKKLGGSLVAYFY